MKSESLMEQEIRRLISDLKKWGQDIDTGHWQGVPTEGHPEMVTKEVFNATLTAGIPREVDWRCYTAHLAQRNNDLLHRQPCTVADLACGAPLVQESCACALEPVQLVEQRLHFLELLLQLTDLLVEDVEHCLLSLAYLLHGTYPSLVKVHSR